jgi:hypothetical protein
VRRLAVIIFCALALPAASAQAWTWPVDGPILRPFLFDSAHPYAGGQHRGIDIGGEEGASVRSPIDGVVSFAGTVPTGGKTVSVETPLGYTATLLHLGTIAVKRGSSVAEGTTIVGTVGSAEDAQPYVYFGVRVTSEPQGYVDPLRLLPPRPSSESPPVAEGASVAVTPAASGKSTAQSSEQAPEAVPAIPGEAAASASELPAATPEPAAPAEPAPAAEPAQVPSSNEAPATTNGPAPTASQLSSPAPTATVPVAAPAPALVPLAPSAAATEAAPAAVEGIDADRGTSLMGAALPPTPLLGVGLLPVDSPTANTASTLTLLDPTLVPTLVRSAHPVSEHSVADRSVSDPHSPGSASPATSGAIVSGRHGASPRLELRDAVIGALFGAVCGAFALLLRRRRNAVGAKPTRIMSVPVGSTDEEDPGCTRVAVRERSASPRTRGGLRGAGRHLRALPQAEGQRRPDGERDGRARDAGDGLRRPGRRLAA